MVPLLARPESLLVVRRVGKVPKGRVDLAVLHKTHVVDLRVDCRVDHLLQLTGTGDQNGFLVLLHMDSDKGTGRLCLF